MDLDKLKSVIESILFISGEPVKVAKIMKITGARKPEVENAIMVLQNEYSGLRGLSVIRKEDEVQMGTDPENATFVSELVKSEAQENLSRTALEVLSIVAYRGPLSRMDIDAIRGVNSTFSLRSLLMRGLVERIDNPKSGRSFLYKISFDFLRHLGLDDISKLPDWEELSKDTRVENVIENNNEITERV
ncbi:MAG TPA: SMC-Scp complex subunit ScpB [Patescibacteria group bacterium]|nr:SMC-Scp complex subunit ScpB [Patescibacteria group bacterium]